MAGSLMSAITEWLQSIDRSADATTPSAGHGRWFWKNKAPYGVNSDGTVFAMAAGAGDVVGPASAVDGDVVLFDSTTGKLIKSGGGFLPVKAKIVFDGTGVVSVKSSYNMTVTDNGNGDYTLNFTTSLPDDDYAVLLSAQGVGGGGGMRHAVLHHDTPTHTVDAVRIYTLDQSYNPADSPLVSVVVV